MTPQVALITGAANGIGLAFAKLLSSHGYAVVMTDIDEEKVAHEASILQSKSEQKILGLKLDVRSLDDFKKVQSAIYDQFEHIDLFLAGAGVGAGAKKIFNQDPEICEWVIDINYMGVIRGLQTIGKQMISSGKPCKISTISSEHGLGLPFFGNGVYTGTKHALLGLFDSFRYEVPEQVEVSIIFPGAVNTNIGAPSAYNLANPSVESYELRKKFMEEGYTPEYAAELIYRGLISGDFLIPLHPHMIRYARTRYEQLQEAFEKHAPYTQESERYHSQNIIDRVRGNNTHPSN